MKLVNETGLKLEQGIEPSWTDDDYKYINIPSLTIQKLEDLLKKHKMVNDEIYNFDAIREKKNDNWNREVESVEKLDRTTVYLLSKPILSLCAKYLNKNKFNIVAYFEKNS